MSQSKLLFPILRESNGTLSLHAEPTFIADAEDLRSSIRRIEQMVQFHSWGVDPITGECHVEITEESRQKWKEAFMKSGPARFCD